ADACSRTFPIQGGLLIPWWAAQRAYEQYARCYGRAQSLEKLAARGGFGLHEWAALFSGRREPHNSEIERLTAAALAKVFAPPPIHRPIPQPIPARVGRP